MLVVEGGGEEGRASPVLGVLTSKNNPKANYRFFSGATKPGLQDSRQPEVVPHARGSGLRRLC